MQIARWMVMAGLTLLTTAHAARADDSPLAGDRLWLRGDGASSSNRALLRLLDDAVDVSGLDPAQTGGTVTFLSPSTGEKLTFPLPASGWTKATNGRERRFSAVVNGVRVRASLVGGRAVRVSAPGINVPPLAGPLGGVAAVVDIGSTRFCGWFGGTVAYDDGTQFLARRAPRPTTSCADVQCIGAADGLACDDGNPATTGEICVAGTCAPNLCLGVTCTASDACHLAGTCDPPTGLCSNPTAADGTSCSDSDACTQTDTCSAGVCTGGNPITCAASGQCVVGVCDKATGVCSEQAAPKGTECSDGNAATTQDQCDAGACVQATCPCRGVAKAETVWSATWPGDSCFDVSIFQVLEANDETEAACGQLTVQTDGGQPYCRVQDGELEIEVDPFDGEVEIDCDATDGDDEVLGPLTPKEAELCRGDLRSFATAHGTSCPF